MNCLYEPGSPLALGDGIPSYTSHGADPRPSKVTDSIRAPWSRGIVGKLCLKQCNMHKRDSQGWLVEAILKYGIC